MFLAERDDFVFINERNASCPRADSNLEPEDEFGGAAFEEHDAIQDLFLLVDSSSLAVISHLKFHSINISIDSIHALSIMKVVSRPLFYFLEGSVKGTRTCKTTCR